MNLKDCHNFVDFRKLAKKKLPSPIFHYIDGAADDEITYARNTSAFDDVDLVPNVLEELKMLIYQLHIWKEIRLTFLSCTNSASKTFSL
jgi:L-lactate dehydrogenase (cytochrome)